MLIGRQIQRLGDHIRLRVSLAQAGHVESYGSGAQQGAGNLHLAAFPLDAAHDAAPLDGDDATEPGDCTVIRSESLRRRTPWMAADTSILRPWLSSLTGMICRPCDSMGAGPIATTRSW